MLLCQGPGSPLVSTDGDALELLETVTVRGEGERPMGRWEPCREPIIFDGLPQGRYGFRLQPIDAAGNVGPVSDPYVFEVDPALPIPEFAADEDGAGDGGTATVEALPVDGGPPLMRADTMTIVGATLFSLAAAITVRSASLPTLICSEATALLVREHELPTYVNAALSTDLRVLYSTVPPSTYSTVPAVPTCMRVSSCLPT